MKCSLKNGVRIIPIGCDFICRCFVYGIEWVPFDGISLSDNTINGVGRGV